MNIDTADCFTSGEELILGSWLFAEGTKHDELAFPPRPVNETDIYRRALKDIGIEDTFSASIVSPLAVGVSRILLRDVATRLPHWYSIGHGGNIIEGRKDDWQDKIQKSIGILPIELFEINWASSGPGFDWPEHYHACPVPGDNITVITASADSPEMHGYTDWALGWFPGNDNLVDYAGLIIRAWWRAQRDGWGQASWETVFRPGRVRESMACAWREEVWDVSID